MNQFKRSLITTLCLIPLSLGLSQADEALSKNEHIIRDPAPNQFPISQSVIIPPKATTYYLSGVVPNPQEDGAFGDTKTQTISILKQTENNLEKLGLTFADVVKMQVFIVADPNLNNKMDFTGFMEGYTLFFGTQSQPNTPARSAFEVAGLAHPDFLIEIEVVAAKVI